ncbi:MAG: hypothetical protein ACE5E6_10490 [Phycisphaerae bacterium]
MAAAAAALVTGACFAAAAPGATAGDGSDRSIGPSVSINRTELRLARSKDGLAFTDAGRVFARRAAAPDLVRWPNDRLIALFDHVMGSADGGRAVMVTTRSRDIGRSWSLPRPLRFGDGRHADVRGLHGDLVRMSGGHLRLYFASPDDADHRARSEEAAPRVRILSAVTRNGVTYRLDTGARIGLAGAADIHPTAARIDGAIHLYAAEPAGHRGAAGDAPRGAATTSTDPTEPRRPAVRHARSRRGRRFRRARRPSLPDVTFVGSIVPNGQGVRAYVSSNEGIRSAVSTDGRQWTLERGLRLPGGWDPAVVRLADGSFLMLYCAPLAERSRGATQVVYASAAPGSRSSGGNGRDDERGSNDDAARDGDRTIQPGDDASADVAALLDGLPNAWPVGYEGFAPRPDFETKIDYIAWVRDNLIGHPDDNAFDVYASFMPNLWVDGEAEPDWPDFHALFGAIEDGPPAPWAPAAHPEWATASRAVQGLLSQYREATTHTGYARPLKIMSGQGSASGFDEPLLIGMLLPDLSKHRLLAKAALADAWRMEDGRVSPTRMVESWKTVLRAAGHMDQGATLIEDLVAAAERALVQKTARWALRRGVFTDAELADALDVLSTYDVDNGSLAPRFRGEHAFAMETTQYIFDTVDEDGQPRVNRERFEAVMGFSGAGADRARLQALAAMGPADAYASLDAFDAFYEQLSDLAAIGYPEVRAADMTAATEAYVHATPLTEMLLPSLSRVYQLEARCETSRRATQLAYAAHLFKARHRRWPRSVDEVAAEYGPTMGIDPFTGESFGYRVDDDGPVIYSLSENGVDDGGVHSPRWADDITNDVGSDDHVFWPPQPR